MTKKIVILLLAAFASAGWYFAHSMGPPSPVATGYGLIPSTPDYAPCEVDIRPGLLKLAYQTFPKKYFPDLSVEIFKKNDEVCSDEVNMFNVAVVLRGFPSPPEQYYAIFHVHFAKDGAITSAAVNTPWQPLTGEGLAPVQTDWCLLIKAVYPDEATFHGCY